MTVAGQTRSAPVPRLGVIGCGDVLYRSYLPGLATAADRLDIVACCDVDSERASRAARFAERWWSSVAVYDDLDDLLARDGLDGVFNLTPAPRHFAVNRAVLSSGRHVYSEKPLADTVPNAQSLIRAADERGLLLQAAPAVMSTPRFRWLRRLVASGLIGRPTLASAQLANLGPAAWRVYTGDPAVYYGSHVGPLLDQGVYLLHAITGLMGPAQRIQAFGGIAIPERRVVTGKRAGEAIRVEANDHMLVHLDFGGSRFAQLLSSFAVPATRVPTLEVHGTRGTVSIPNADSRSCAPVDVFLADSGPLGVEGWMEGLGPAVDAEVEDLIGFGPLHFAACLRGEQPPLLPPDHACHVLEIAQAAFKSVREGCAAELATTFGDDGEWR